MEVSVPKIDWDDRLQQLLSSHDLFAPVKSHSSLDYVKIEAGRIPDIVYNQAKTVTPLKTFFLPMKENLTSEKEEEKPLVILGPPSCDISALALLDAIYLDEDFPDPAFAKRRAQSTLISMDCLSIEEHCHCTTYGIEPGCNKMADLSLALLDEQVVLRIYSPKGEQVLESMGILVPESPSEQLLENLDRKREYVKQQLEDQNKELPDYESSGKLILAAADEFWDKQAATCVSCGACSAICPTCSCFLLLDRPGFEKVRQLDTCQYPGFERVAGGEDPLHRLGQRFRNRYMCKYVWKPEKYSLKACTGCGRCTDTCIGQINKNELIQALLN